MAQSVQMSAKLIQQLDILVWITKHNLMHRNMCGLSQEAVVDIRLQETSHLLVRIRDVGLLRNSQPLNQGYQLE